MLVFDVVMLTRYQVPELPFRSLIPGPKRLVGVKQQALCHVCVELPHDVAGVGNQPVVISKKRTDQLPYDGLADTLLAAKAQGRARLDDRLLPYLAEEPDDPIEQVIIALGDVVPDVGQEL